LNLIPLNSKQVNNLVMLYISDDTSVLVEQVQFINPDTCTVESGNLCMLVGFLKDATNGSFIQSRIIGDTGERSSERITSNVEDQALCHHVMFVHVVERFKEGFVAGAATIAFPHDQDACSLPSNGDIQKQLMFDFMSVEHGVIAIRAAQRNRILFSGDLIVMFMLFMGH
jgi:hypothetical protein